MIYYTQNNIGSTTLLTDKNGSDVGQFLYAPFGEMWVEEVSSVDISHITRFFTNQQYDKESGLYYYNARYYDPHLRSSITPDPAMQNLNHYAYCSTNPIKYTDPTGLWGGDEDYDGEQVGGGDNGDDDESTTNNETNSTNSSDSILSWLNDPKIKNELNIPFKDNSPIDFTYNWTPENGNDQFNQIMNSTWDGGQKVLSHIPYKDNALCLVADMLWDCLKKLDVKITVREARDIIYKLEKEGAIYTLGSKLGYMNNNSSEIQNKVWEYLKDKPGWIDGNWVHSYDFSLKSTVGNNKYGYVKSPSKSQGGHYPVEHWFSVKGLNYELKSIEGQSFKTQQLSSVLVFDPF